MLGSTGASEAERECHIGCQSTVQSRHYSSLKHAALIARTGHLLAGRAGRDDPAHAMWQCLSQAPGDGSGDAAGALADCDAALAVDPVHTKAAYRKGLALLALRRFEDAAAWLGSRAAVAAAADAPSFAAAAERARVCVAQRHGTFDWVRLSFDALDKDAALVANFVHAALEVRVSRGKGRGLYVARSVRADTLLLAE